MWYSVMCLSISHSQNKDDDDEGKSNVCGANKCNNIRLINQSNSTRLIHVTGEDFLTKLLWSKYVSKNAYRSKMSVYDAQMTYTIVSYQK